MAHIWQALRSGDWLTLARARGYSLILLALCGIAVAGWVAVSDGLVDRNGKPLGVPAQVTEREDPSGAFRWIVVDSALAPFAPGDYAIEVSQGSAKQVTGFRIVP